MIILDVSACTGVDIPDGRHCHPDGEGGYEIVCISSCPKPSPDNQVCAEDYGVYPSTCHMHMETCQMYGVDVKVGEKDLSYCREANRLGNSLLTKVHVFARFCSLRFIWFVCSFANPFQSNLQMIVHLQFITLCIKLNTP